MRVSAEQSVESAYGWWVAIASTLMIAVSFGSTYLVVIGLKPIAAEFGWPRQIPSAGYSAALFGAGVGGILMGLWQDRRGMAGPSMMGAIFVSLGVFYSLFSSFGLLFFFLFFVLVFLHIGVRTSLSRIFCLNLWK